MTLIKRTENGQVVRHDYGYFYLADDFGNPAGGGYWDQAEAEAELDDPEDALAWDLDLNDLGDPDGDGGGRFAKVQVDLENGGEDFWGAISKHFRVCAEDWDPQLWELVDTAACDLVWVPLAEARRFSALCESLPDWASPDAPEFAPHPVIFDFPAES